MAKKALNKTIRTFYGFGDLGFTLMSSVELYFFIFFLTNVAKFSLPMVALIASVTSIVDAVLSPFYGAFLSGTKPLKWGRNRSWLLLAPIPVVLLYMFEFTKIGSEPTAAIIVCAGFILSHILWNMAWVANVSLIPTMATNAEERSLLSARRSTWTSLNGVFFSYIAPPLAVYFGLMTGNPVLGYTFLAGFMGLAFIVTYFTVFKITDGYEAVEVAPTGTAAGVHLEKVSASVMLKSVFQNPPLIALLVGDLLRWISYFIMVSSAAYVFTYVMKNMALFPLYLLIESVFMVMGAWVSGPIAKAISSRTTAIIGLVGLAASLLICKLVATNLILFFAFIVLQGAFTGLLNSVMVALYSDVAVYGEWKTGKNASSFVMGMMTLSLKIAIISRGTVIPLVLGAAGFIVGADAATASPQLQNAVLNVFLSIPGLFAIAAAVVMAVGYRLSRSKLETYQAEIDAKIVQAA